MCWCCASCYYHDEDTIDINQQQSNGGGDQRRSSFDSTQQGSAVKRVPYCIYMFNATMFSETSPNVYIYNEGMLDLQFPLKQWATIPSCRDAMVSVKGWGLFGAKVSRDTFFLLSREGGRFKFKMDENKIVKLTRGERFSYYGGSCGFGLWNNILVCFTTDGRHRKFDIGSTDFPVLSD
eukprot:CAMPEP_0114987474 /NCGR_PEP_ID=MMETSP0216-20121206/9028_1 /TAXON_ID=223996 /ORGANISM="Protocruzia adherens, Strain Boccale" /LENGTH=178 /DNA_ID=CAMNT_0002350077 /DNA_START=1 /DNA_END=537 /DNA_ORIENTATION=+